MPEEVRASMTRKEWDALYKKSLVELKANNFALRSCWKCNAAHEHLKGAGYIIRCFECGHAFFKGHDLSELTDAWDPDDA